MKKKLGFTLIEIVVVMGIIAVLSLLVVGAISVARTTANNTRIETDGKNIELAINAFSLKNRRYPKWSEATPDNVSSITRPNALIDFLKSTGHLDTNFSTKAIGHYKTTLTGDHYILVICDSKTTLDNNGGAVMNLDVYALQPAGAVPYTSNPCPGGAVLYWNVK